MTLDTVALVLMCILALVLWRPHSDNRRVIALVLLAAIAIILGYQLLTEPWFHAGQ